jgi:hypothetical protein
MRRSRILLVLGWLLAVGCATGKPQTQMDSSGLVRIDTKGQGELFAHPSRSIDHYDDILVGEVNLDYAPKQEPLSQDDLRRFQTMAYGIIVRQIPAAGQLSAREPGPCTVKLGVQFHDLQFPGSRARQNGSTTVILEFRDSQSGDPVVRYAQQRELSLGSGAEREGPGPDLGRLEATLEIVAEEVRGHFRDALPLNANGARASLGCKGVIGAVRTQAKQAQKK